MTDTKIINWMHNRRVEVVWWDDTCEVTLYDHDNEPVIRKRAMTARHALREAYSQYKSILELGNGEVA